MNTLFQDIRYSFRQLAKAPGFVFVAVLTLALGIGANTAIFSVVSGVVLNPLHFPHSDRLVSVFYDKPDFPRGSISYPAFLDWQRENHSFEGLAAYRDTDGTIRGSGPAENVRAQRISATFFSILGVKPILGRDFSAEDDRRGANATALISEGLWRRRFASDPNVIGKRLIVGDEVQTIIGVIPGSFHLNIQNFRDAELYEPIGAETDVAFFKRDSFWGTDAIGMLKPGVSLDQARQDMKHVNAGLAAAYPDIDAKIKANIMTVKEEMIGDIRPVLLVLLGAVGFVLLIACVNVANLLLARSTVRQREFSIRASLGAGQRRIVRQLLTESVLLSLTGGILGVALAKWGTVAALATVPTGGFLPVIPRTDEIALDLKVFLFAFALSLLTGIFFGLAPAFKVSRASLGDMLKETARSISGHRSRAQSLLVIGEMAMALVLLVGAGLMLRTLMHLWQLSPGFDPHNVVKFGVSLPPSSATQTADAARAALRRTDADIRSVPGVESVSLSWGATPMESDNEKPFITEGQQPTSRQADLPLTLEYRVEPAYFQTMRLSLLRGRFLSDRDNEHSGRVAVIDEGFAKKYFAGQDPIGKHVSIFDFGSDPTQRVWNPFTVVGVVGHIKQFGLSDDSSQRLQAELFRPAMQSSDAAIKDMPQGATVFARFGAPLTPEAAFQAIRKKLIAENDQIIISDDEDEEAVVSRSIASQRFSLALLGAFAGLALLLASIGIYGVLSYLVGQRTPEIGVRMALGAQRSDVMRMVLRDGARMTLIGAAVGIAAALGLTRLMASMLFGVKPTDPITFAGVAVVLSAIALFSCYLPARRASRVDPMVALRYE